MEPTMKLKQAVQSYREGNKQAFTMLYEESSKYVYTCIYKVMGGNDNVQDTVCDIMQDTYVEISKKIGQLGDEASFLSWAGTIATRKCYAWLKKNKKYVLLNEEDDTFTNLADEDDIIPEGIMQDREKQRMVREIIDTQLTQMQKLCIIAYYYNEQKQSEIAKELGIPENTVKTNLSRARAKIKDGVLDLEKRQGTKLYSVAPVLLMLFQEDVSACAVPVSVAAAVQGSVAAAGKMGMKHLLGKMAEASAKAKVTAGAIGAGAVIAVGTAAYVAMQDKGESWEEEFRNYLLRSDRAAGFDLNDFEEDGIPELIVLNQDGSMSIRYSDAYEEPAAFELDAVEEMDFPGSHVKNVYHYGYDVNVDRILRLCGTVVTIESGKEGYNHGFTSTEFQNGECETKEAIACVFEADTNPISWSYDRIGLEGEVKIPQLFADGYTHEAYQRFNVIEYTDITKRDIDERFREFRENGNRERAWNDDSAEVMENLNMMQEPGALEERMDDPAIVEIYNQMSYDDAVEFLKSQKSLGSPESQEPEASPKPQETSTVETEIALSEEEQESLQVMTSVFTLNSYLFTDDMYGNSYPVSDLEAAMRLIDMMGCFAQTDDSYLRRLPAMEVEPQTLKKYFEIEDMKSYLKNVFGIEDADLSAYYEGDKVVLSMVGEPISHDENVIDTAVQMSEGVYGISGTYFLSEASDDFEAGFPYTITVAKNDASLFGFQMISMEFGEDVVENQSGQASGDGSLSDILLNSSGNSAYYPQGVEYGRQYFALLDIDQDGEDEILLGTTDTFDYYEKPIWITIFNVLKYDRGTGETWDFDGDNVYQPLDANSWHYYDTGILLTMAEVGSGHTYAWNLLTGEFTDTEAVNPDYKTLTSGTEIPIVWYEVNQGNLQAMITGGTMEAVDVPTPYGTYSTNRGEELEFSDNGTVRVSEGGSHKDCAFTIDGEGNLVIDPDGEALEGTYNAQTDIIWIDNLKFRR